MSLEILKVPLTNNNELRDVYSNTLISLTKENDKVVALEADLMGTVKMNNYQEACPENFINCGIMEANMVGIASGLSLRGLIPFMHSFGPFATRRCFDQLFLSIGYADLNLTVIGSDAGVTATHNGGTHMPFEDIGLMRLIPNSTVIEISDFVMFKDILKQVVNIYGLFYIRIVRKTMIQIYEEGSSFKIGQGIVLKEGKDATVIATGIMIKEALEAANELLKENISISVIDMFTIKPIDQDLLIKYAKKTKLVITAENHNIIGGLGSAVAECLAENYPTKVIRIGVKERFGQVGTQDFLQSEYGLTKDDIINAVKENI